MPNAGEDYRLPRLLVEIAMGAPGMLHDMRGTYIRREEPRSQALAKITIAALWVLTLAAFAAVIWGSLNSGEVAYPSTYFPYFAPAE